MALLTRGVTSLSASLEQYAALLASVWWRRRKASGHGCEAPLLHVCFDENKSHLSEVDVDSAWSIGADCGEEILCFQSMGNVVQLFAIAREKYRPTPGSVADANNVTLNILRTVDGWNERLVESAVPRRNVGDR